MSEAVWLNARATVNGKSGSEAEIILEPMHFENSNEAMKAALEWVEGGCSPAIGRLTSISLKLTTVEPT